MSHFIQKNTVLYTLLHPAGRWLWDTKRIFRIARESSYYPEKARKNYFERLHDLRVWQRKWKEANESYNLYGLDIKGSDPDLWCDYVRTFASRRNKANASGELYSMTGLLEDKFQFFRTMKSLGILTPEVFAILDHGRLRDAEMNDIDWEDLQERSDYFVKDAHGLCGKLVKHIQNYDELLKLKPELPDGVYIFQERIRQCAEEDRLYSGSVNTLRIVTVNPRHEKSDPYVLAILQRVGCKGSGVDNWTAGGIAVGIEENGYLKQFGYRKYQYGGKTDVHPDSGVRFSEFRVPMVNEAIDLVLKVHRFFYSVHSIGWDIALTDDGPMLVEGNENWDLRLMQACDHPLRADWEQALSR